MRSTPQRRAILSVFHGGRTEHLSADEVYARATRSLPELSRATVYATLAEFSELGLLSAFGSPEPVRYETNLDPHAHFRCHLCARVFDLTGGHQDPGRIKDPGFIVERIETRAEGICGECTDYRSGLAVGAKSIKASAPGTDTIAAPGTAAAEIDTPLAKLLVAATPNGLARVAFEDHADADALRARASTRRGSKAAHQHLMHARENLRRYFAGDLARPDCIIDWTQVGLASRSALTATQTIPYATHRSYNELGLPLSARDLGNVFGTNPIPIFAPCHRVSRGSEIPTSFVGGPKRRSWLEAHELR
jgi:Fe2+ or Zn2+ uptake regulation protein/O6-methylguanine-DNA--protein-cysteine methyltransferase